MIANGSSGRTERLRVLVVDDDPAVAEVASQYLEGHLQWVETIAETEPGDAVERIATDPSIDCVISDYRMPEIDGLELHDRIRDRRPGLSFVLFTADMTAELRQKASEAGVAAFVEKDGSVDNFDALIESVRREAT